MSSLEQLSQRSAVAPPLNLRTLSVPHIIHGVTVNTSPANDTPIDNALSATSGLPHFAFSTVSSILDAVPVMGKCCKMTETARQ